VRIRITFEKTAAMRYTGHLDLHRTWERTFRRARLPLAYSLGFHPHPRINLASALPLGFTSLDEVVDVWLESDSPPQAIEEALRPALPPGIVVKRIEEIDPHAPALQTVLEASEYVITLLEPLADLEARIQGLLAAESLMRRRRKKDYDLRPLIHTLGTLPEDEEGCSRLAARLSAREGATGRPEDVVEALGADPEAIRVERTKLVFRD
jgi:radical SAM-linked protein